MKVFEKLFSNNQGNVEECTKLEISQGFIQNVKIKAKDFLDKIIQMEICKFLS